MDTPSAQRTKRYPQITRPNELGAAIEGLRRSLRLTQADLATRAHVSRKWISEVENGKPTAEVGRVCRVLECVGAHLEIVWRPPLAESVLDEVIAEHQRAPAACS